MATSVQEVMTRHPITVSSTATLFEAAKIMRDSSIGDVIVLDEKDKLCGIVTDRDITVRGVADGRDPKSTNLGDICSKHVTTLEPESSVKEAVQLMRNNAIRRLPVLKNGKPVGIVSLGDLALEQDENSALADISAAPPNS